MSSVRAFVLLAGSLAVSALVACGEPLGGDRPVVATASGNPVNPVTPVDPAPADPGTAAEAGPPPDGGTATDAGVPDPQGGTYEVMCRHYCETLEQTLVYSCLASGGDAVECAQKFQGTTARCYDGRCVPRLVEASLCLRQCDALTSNYAAVCGTDGVVSEPLCPSPSTAHDDACRAGCAPAGS